MPHLHHVVTVAFALLIGLPPPSLVTGASVGVNATHIIIGQTVPLTGLQGDAGIRIAAGLQVAFEEANAAGGVQSRNLTLLSLDDGYVLNQSLANFLTLENQTLLMAGAYGSDINAALLPLVVGTGMPSVGPITGSAATRSPFQEEVINVRASIADEMVVQAILMVEKLRVHRIACLYQNDSFGLTSLSSITAALNHVGLQVMVAASYPAGTADIEPALEIIAGHPQRAQAVVMASLEAQSSKFIRLFRQDPRMDPNCTFLLCSIGVTSTFASQLEPEYWSSLYFTQTVPPLDTPSLDIVTQFQTAADLYLPTNLTADFTSLEGYLVGQLIVQVVQGIPGEITRKSFLNELYNTRLYAFGGLLAGMYSRNFSGCKKIVCSSNIGLRSVFSATLDPATGAMHYNDSLGTYSFSVTELGFPVTNIVRPLLFGQLVPTDDPVWQQVAEAIGEGLQDAFAQLNSAGGVGGRPVELVQWRYTGEAAPHAAVLADRYDLLALVGSVVNRLESLESTSVAQIGTYQTDPLATDSAFNFTEVLVQASQSLQIMALTSFALQLGLPVHVRAPATAAGQIALQMMVRSLHSLQQQPTSSRTYASPNEALNDLSSGAVIAVGSDADILAMFLALADLPQLRLLTTSPRAVHLLGTLNVPTYSQATRFHYPYTFSTTSLTVVSGPEVQDATLYGQLLGSVMRTVLQRVGNASLAYTTTAQLLDTWYGTQYKYNGVTLGPYYSASCLASASKDCECNEGVRQVTVLTATRQEEPTAFSFVLSTCRVEYDDLIVPGEEGPWYIGVIVGVVGGVLVFGLLGWWLVHRGQRDNAAAPKDCNEPFCILFTDIQASTHLWAAVPDVMTTALAVHHVLIRRLIAKHKLYEVKTIGDSFMCATRSPSQAVEFALGLQREFFEYDWGTDRIDTTYLLQQDDEKAVWGGAHGVWNGLRVRVGIHFGLGEVHLDEVSKGYDYYGTVVNTAARVEAVCHGGQIGVTQAVHDALNGEFLGASVADLGEQILRGLAEPVHLYQLVPLELKGRVFPSLRLEHAAAAELEVRGRRPTEFRASPSKASLGVDVRSALGIPHKSSVATGTASTTLTHGSHWVESHPLVRGGQMSAQELNMRYLTVLKALTTLMEVQTERVRAVSLRAYCERLQVRNAGTEGPQLEETLNGIVQRVLPAALMAVGFLPGRPAAASRRASSDVAPDDLELSPVSEFRPPLMVRSSREEVHVPMEDV